MKRRTSLYAGLACLALVLAGVGAYAWQLPSVQMALLERASLEQLERRVEAEPDDWRVQYWFGKRAAESGDFLRAEPALRRVLGTEWGFTPAATELGRVLLAKGEVNEAFQLLRMAVGREGQPDARLALGQLYRSQGAHHLAMEQLKEALKARPNDAQALYELAAAHAQVQQYEQAEENLRRALSLAPKSPLFLTALSRIRRERGDLAEAESLAREAVALQPDAPDALMELSRALAMKLPAEKHRPEAIATLESALTLAPRHPGLRLELAKLHGEAENWPASVTLLEQAIQLTPGETQAYYLLSRAYRALGRTEDSQRMDGVFKRRQAYDRKVQALGAKIGANPENAKLRFELGELHASEGELDQAAQSYRNGLQWDPKNETARRRMVELVRQATQRRADRGTPR
ncbi:MAG: tetratricopeptide repeat protein [Armatimonadota bacterium]